MSELKSREVLTVPIGSFSVTMDDPRGTVVTVGMYTPLHFEVHHYKSNGMEFVKCREVKSLTTEKSPEYVRDYTMCNIYREIVYKLWKSDIALGKKGARNQLRILKEYCNIIKEV